MVRRGMVKNREGSILVGVISELKSGVIGDVQAGRQPDILN